MQQSAASYVGVFYSIKLDLPVIKKNVVQERREQHTVSWSEILKIDSEFKKKLSSMFKVHFGLIYSFREGLDGLDLDL